MLVRPRIIAAYLPTRRPRGHWQAGVGRRPAVARGPQWRCVGPGVCQWAQWPAAGVRMRVRACAKWPPTFKFKQRLPAVTFGPASRRYTAGRGSAGRLGGLEPGLGLGPAGRVEGLEVIYMDNHVMARPASPDARPPLPSCDTVSPPPTPKQ